MLYVERGGGGSKKFKKKKKGEKFEKNLLFYFLKYVWQFWSFKAPCGWEYLIF